MMEVDWDDALLAPCFAVGSDGSTLSSTSTDPPSSVPSIGIEDWQLCDPLIVWDTGCHCQ